MLATLRLGSLRHVLVVVVMILSALVAFERVQAIVNSAQHGLALDRVSPGLTLALVADHDHVVASHDHVALGHGAARHDLANHDATPHEAGEAAPADGADTDPAPGPHHHHVEGVQVAALPAPLTVEAAISRSAAVFVYTQSGSPRSRIFGLERPPKALDARA